MAEVPSGRFAGQDVGEENALIDLDAILVALQQPGLCGKLGRRRGNAGNGLGGGEYQLL